jgi:hypothetical protein
MDSISIDGFGCAEARQLSDAFVDRELLGETQSQMLQHILRCIHCSAFVDEQIRLKRLVRASVKAVTVPATLLRNVRACIGV